ncbi:MAG: membrane protein insertase YidC [Alphaproteobacteria bacterium]|nr:membrane protein insertase YidC [Alphaproteobacteria bacterium]MDD9919369.1 membrane protein insertase YidC [Alphaproteobacteria bacterium]
MDMLPNPGQGGSDTRNLIIAVVISVLVFLGFDYYMALQQPVPTPTAQTDVVESAEGGALVPEALSAKPLAGVEMPAAVAVPTTKVDAQQISIKNSFYDGRINSKGGRLDTLHLDLSQYGKDLPEENWFTKLGDYPQYLDTGWLGTGLLTPTPDALWQSTGGAGNEARLVWSNNQGQIFERLFTLREDKHFVTVTDRVTNQTNVPVSVQHYAQMIRGGGEFASEQSTWMNYFGPIGLVEGVLVEESFDDVAEANVTQEGRGGWWGISTQYFITAIGAPKDMETVRRFNHTRQQGKDLYTAVVQRHPVTVQPNQTVEVVTDVYVGPKSVEALAGAGYALERAVDYGWFSMLAEPMYHALVWFYEKLGNWGLAIIGLTIALKIVTFPLTYKSFASMAKLKTLQPEMKAMQERYADEREKMAMEMMRLYKEHKVSPLSGCWPMLIQMPIFFAMYKVMLISFELHGAPFYGWVTDLSLQDPYFVLPVLMGASMWVQMQLNPQAGDPVQQQIMKFLPIIFTVFFLFFPSGLVLYWLTNNVISVAQQWWMLKRAE